MPTNLLNNLKRSVVVAMVAVRMMKASLNQIVNMVIMGNSRVAAIGTVNVLRRMFSRGKSRRAFVGIGGIDRNRVFVHMIAMRMVKMAIMKIIHVPFMLDCGVSASWCVDMRVIRMGGTRFFVHIFFRLFCLSRHFLLIKHPIAREARQELFLQVTCT
jgi:hypothetical protein